MIDTTNKFLVAVRGSGEDVLVMNPPRGPLSKPDALLLAAYLVTMAMAAPEEFQAVLEAVQST